MNGRILTDWKHFPVQLEEISKHKHQQGYSNNPGFGDTLTLPAIYKGELSIGEAPEDTYIDMSKWTKVNMGCTILDCEKLETCPN